MTLELLESTELDYIDFGVCTGAYPGVLERVFIWIKAGILFTSFESKNKIETSFQDK